MKTNQKGFTLIELLIIIGIIAILAVAIVVSINPAKQFEAARNSTRWSHINAIMTSVYTYAVSNNGTFPPCVDGANIGQDVDAYECTANLSEYIRSIPRDPQAPTSPATTTCYVINYSTTTASVTVKPIKTGDCDSVIDNISGIELVQ